MFVQVIEGRVRDKDGLLTQVDRWMKELAPGSIGWLGATGGIAEDGTFIMIARFESEDAAKSNSDRPEQGEWWAQTAPHLEDAIFRDCARVDTFGAGGSDSAGFVQVIQGRGDRDRIVPKQAELDEFLSRTRPDVHGGIVAWQDDDTFTQVVYFESEAEARKNEQSELSEEDAARFGEIMALMEMQRFIDLREPLLYSA
jgi:hypothetical protein